MIKVLSILLVCVVGSVVAARPPKATVLRPVLVLKNNAILPRFTTDHRGQAVLSWVEKRSDDDKALYFAPLTAAGKLAGAPIRVTSAPVTISAHAEGMPKVAYKADGTIIALFEVSKPTDEAPRAGDLLYTESKDGGHTWSEAHTVHRDQTPGKGHSFADMARLPNGQIGIVWLDEKMPGYEGRSVKFTQTLPDGEFGPEVLLDSNACQCCRTSLLAGPDGRLHIAYRDMLAGNKTASEADARDMSYVVSTDMGKTFSRPATLNHDNWRINACPHSGIQLAANKDGLWATWYSGTADKPGLRLTSIGDSTHTTVFGTSAMKHPQVALLADNSVAVIWDELVGEGMNAYRKIGWRQQQRDGRVSTRYLTPAGQMSTGPVVFQSGSTVLLAYEVTDGIYLIDVSGQLQN